MLFATVRYPTAPAGSAGSEYRPPVQKGQASPARRPIAPHLFEKFDVLAVVMMLDA
ncbi:MAG: hypothetical protein ACREV7_19035 [Steroidobacteraceae bacterium]